MVPYAKLSEAAKAIDRQSVLGYPERLKAAGYRVVWLGGAKKSGGG